MSFLQGFTKDLFRNVQVIKRVSMFTHNPKKSQATSYFRSYINTAIRGIVAASVNIPA